MPFKFTQKIVILFLAIFTITNAVAQQAEIEAAKNYLKKYQEKYRLSDSDLNNITVKDAYFSKTTGIYHIYFGQKHQSIEVFNGICNVAIKDGNLVSVANSFVPNIQFQTALKTSVNLISAKNGLISAIKYLNLASISNSDIKSIYSKTNVNGISVKETFENKSISNQPIQADLVWFKQDFIDPESKKTDSKIILAWNINILTKDLKSGWSVHVDATSGAVINTYDNVIKCEFGHIHNIKSENSRSKIHVSNQEAKVNNFANNNSYKVFDLSTESPNFGSQTTVNSPYTKFVPSGTGPGNTNGWHEDGTNTYTDTRGNNVFAQEDVYAVNSNGYRPNPTNYIFDYNYTQGLNTSSINQNAAITNLFYWNNLIHDVLWKIGFDEPAGNFQANNMGRGGLGNDFVYADAQDGSGFNNANFYTPPDGYNSRMQMFLWDYSSSYLGDSDFDNAVISHEYGHGWSIRLTGGPSNTSCLQNTEQGGEGWSDYLGLMLTTNWSALTPTITSANIPKGIGTYLLGQTPEGNGIRPYRYSYDMVNINGPVTYAKVGDYNFSEPHGIGSIWATILWDMTWEIILQDNAIEPNIYNTSNMIGNVAALKLVNEGLKLQPCNPSFVDARDAIFAADLAIFDGKYRCALSKAFSRRGLGKNASSGASTNDRTVIEDFTPITGNTLSSPASINICSGTELQYVAKSNTIGTQFSWTRPAVVGISNPASSRNDSLINETLINTTSNPISVFYNFSLTPSGCGQTGPTISTLSVTVNPTQNLPTVTNYSICQNLDIPLNEGLKVVGATNTNTVNGSLQTNSPKYARPSYSSVAYNYQAFSFVAQSTESANFEITSGLYDTYLYLYQGSFNPESPSQNLIASDDDSGVGLLSLLTSSLIKDQTYILVSTTYSPDDIGEFKIVASQNGFQEIYNWYSQAIGGEPIFSGETFNPVGVTNSGIQNTYVPISKIYYVSKNSDSSCRTSATFTISPATVDAQISGKITSSDTICALFNEGTLTLSGHSGTVRGWEISDNYFSDFQFVTSSSPTYNYKNLLGSKQYRVMLDKGNCIIAKSDMATLNVIVPVQILSGTVTRNPTLNKASLKIESNQKLPNTVNVHYDAGRNIELKTGFETNSGTIFEATIFQNECSIPVILTLQPGPSLSKDIDISSLFPNIVYDTNKYLVPLSWSKNYVQENRRSLLQFDLSSIPSNAIIDSAHLFLYYSRTFVSENPAFTGHFGSNSFEIKRIIESWDNTTTWNTQPLTTNVNKVSVSASTSSTQDYPKINVTGLVNDQFKLGNKGFMLNHQTESPYKVTCLTSSNEAIVSNRPKLVIYYRYF